MNPPWKAGKYKTAWMSLLFNKEGVVLEKIKPRGYSEINEEKPSSVFVKHFPSHSIPQKPHLELSLNSAAELSNQIVSWLTMSPKSSLTKVNHQQITVCTRTAIHLFPFLIISCLVCSHRHQFVGFKIVK